LSARLRGCYVWTAVVELGPCVGGEVGTLRGWTAASPSSEAALWASAGLGGALGWRMYRGLAIWAPVLAEIGLVRPTLTIQNTALHAHQPGKVTGRAEMGVEYRF